MLPETVIDALDAGTVQMNEMTNDPGTNYTTILVLRELESHAIFTTSGEDADTTTIPVYGEDGVVQYTPGLMFMRKQTGSDRRVGKSIQRELLDYDTPDTMEINDMNEESVESALYGSAASGDDDVDLGVTSRVMYDDAFSVRDISACVNDKFQNAPGEGYAKGSRSSIREPDFFEPGTLFPCAITLRDATPAEVAFVAAITTRNKRYGAATTRLGRVRNRVLGVYTGSEEGPSNRELAANVITGVAESTDKSVQDVTRSSPISAELAAEIVRETYDDACETRIAQEPVSDDVVEELLGLADDEALQAVLEEQEPMSRDFIQAAISAEK